MSDHSPNSNRSAALYLQRMADHGPWPKGLAYSELLYRCRPDFTAESLDRLDALLDHIRQTEQPQPSAFFADAAKLEWFLLLGFYCGETEGRLNARPPLWFSYEQFVQRFPQQAQGLQRHPARLMCVSYPPENRPVWPLTAIFQRLFGTAGAPRLRTVFAAATAAPQPAPSPVQTATATQLADPALHSADWTFCLNELANPAFTAATRTPLPKVAQAVRSRLNTEQSTALTAFLQRQAAANSTAALYLAYLYASGNGVPQNVAEAANWLNRAADSGDPRAFRMRAEILLSSPSAAPQILHEELNRQYRAMNHAANPLLADRQIDPDTALSRFAADPAARTESIRRYLLLAADKGHPTAQARLQELIGQGRLNAQSSPRHQNLHSWLHAGSDNPPAAPAASPARPANRAAHNALAVMAAREAAQNDETVVHLPPELKPAQDGEEDDILLFPTLFTPEEPKRSGSSRKIVIAIAAVLLLIFMISMLYASIRVGTK